MKKSVYIALTMLAALGVGACGGGNSPAGTGSSSSTIKAAWIYVGPTADHGWTQAHDEGRKYVEQQLGSAVQTTFKENVPEGPQVAQVVEDLIRDGNKIIFGTSFGFQDAMYTEAQKHPDIKFEQATGTKTASNMGEYFGAAEDADYLTGMALGAASKKGKIGFVAPFPIPEVIREINAISLGAQVTHPGATVQVVWTNTWFDPTKEKQAAARGRIVRQRVTRQKPRAFRGADTTRTSHPMRPTSGLPAPSITGVRTTPGRSKR